MKCGARQSSSDGGDFVCDQAIGHTAEFHTDSRMSYTWYPAEKMVRLKRTLARVNPSCVPMPGIFDGNRFNGNEPCDMLVGPCACGASHRPEEWHLTRSMPTDGRTPRPRFNCTCSDTYIAPGFLHALGCPEYAPQFINGG